MGDDVFPIQVIDALFLKSAYGVFTLVCLAVVFLSGARLRLSAAEPKVNHSKNGGAPWFFLKCAGAAALLAAMEALLPQNLSQIMPLATINRLSSFVFYLPLLPTAAALFLFWFWSFALASGRGVYLVGLGALFVFSPLKHEGWLNLTSLKPGVFQGIDASRSWNEYKTRLAHGEAGVSSNKDILLSPSYHVINLSGLWILDEKSLFEREGFEPLEPGFAFFTDYLGRQGEDLLALDPANRGIRWGARSTGQRGNEWLHVRFKEPQRIRGVELVTDRFFSDFPRGILVAAKESCPTQVEAEGFKSVQHLPMWNGPILFTPAGYPYFGGQDQVKIIFPAPLTAQCLMFRQTGKSSFFSWSVTELRLLRTGSN